MARVTVEDCLARVRNRFALTILASRRARALSEGRGHALVECENKEGVTALREISKGRVRFVQDVENAMVDFIEEQRRQLRVTTGEHTFLEAASLRALEDDEVDDEEVEEDEDVEELQTDPEALGKQAKGSAEAEDEEEESEAEESEEAEDFDSDDSGYDDDELPDTGDDAAPPDLDDDSGEEEEEEDDDDDDDD